jgi:GT2 family glycosyltransferase
MSGSATFGFVVLNYVNHEETVDCVQSILRLPGDDYRIVVVDNASPNDSFAVLQARFGGDPRITVLRSSRNGGYSFGNNVGIRALREAGIADVIIATSDTRVEDDRLLERCAEAKAQGIGVVGPYVRDLNDAPQNPLLARLSLRYIAAIHFGRAWDRLRGALARSPLRRALHIGVPESERAAAPSHPVDVYMVHGCFLYLTAHYLKHFPLLDEDIFMYGEEDLIAYNCLRAGLRTVYQPLMRVQHRDARSTVPGSGFREKALAASMKTLRAKMAFTSLVHAYVVARRA